MIGVIIFIILYGLFLYVIMGSHEIKKKESYKAELDRLERIRTEQEVLRLRRHELHTMPYHKYLLTPEWKQISYDAKVRAGFKCQQCDASEKLHVHHNTYKRRGYEADDDLRVLCSICHYSLHKVDIKRRLEWDKKDIIN